MLKNVDWSPIYRTNSKEEPLEFFMDGFCNSIQLDLLLGYFSTSAIRVLSLSFAKFIYSGGTLRMVINNVLSEQDKTLLIHAKNQEEHSLIDIQNIDVLRRHLDSNGVHFFECLAWLIHKKRIQIKVIKPKNGRGISHYKLGVFSDQEQNQVGFTASCNFTAHGLVENLENLTSFLGWETESSKKMIEAYEQDFEAYFDERSDVVEYVNPYDVETVIQEEFGGKNIEELLEQEKKLIGQNNLILKNEKIKRKLQLLEKQIDDLKNAPKFPFEEGPRDYQKQAYQNWVENGYQGIFAMATGTGKTITALNCVLNESRKTDKNIYQVLILVPTLALVKQWEKECQRFNINRIIKVSGNTQWKTELGTSLSTAKRIPISFAVICTYASFIKEHMQTHINSFPQNTILIADEAHNIGSAKLLSLIKQIGIKKRIGLSATPKRFYDEEGTKELEEFFGDNAPYIVSFSMEKAINEGVLCKYYYYPYVVELTPSEMKEYVEISIKIAKLRSFAEKNEEGKKGLEKLLLARKRVIHKAVNKLSIAIDILKKHYQEKKTLKYTLIYVPEGESTDPMLGIDNQENDDDLRLINAYTKAVSEIDNKILVNQYVFGKKDREEVLEQFKSGRIEVLASMKCLDEGVDIPRTETAIFCSSTGNPRQFIQRRGRILRKHEDKAFATIYDLVVIPYCEVNAISSDTFNIEKKLVENEIRRVMYFASLSENPLYTEDVLKEVCQYYKIHIYTIQQELENL